MGQPIWIGIPNDYPLAPGQTVKLYCEWITENLYARASQWAIIEANLEKSHPEFEVLSFNNGEVFLTVEARVIQRPAELQTAAITPLLIVTALGIVVLGIFGWTLLTYTSYLNTGAQTEYAQTTTAKLEAVKWPLIAAAAVAVMFGLVKLK